MGLRAATTSSSSSSSSTSFSSTTSSSSSSSSLLPLNSLLLVHSLGKNPERIECTSSTTTTPTTRTLIAGCCVVNTTAAIANTISNTVNTDVIIKRTTNNKEICKKGKTTSIQKIFLPPNVLPSNEMAPALTEPLSPTNKLTSSATSASPRPISTNYILNNNNITNRSNNINNNNNNNNNNINNHISDNNIELQNSTFINNSNFLPTKKTGQLIISTTSSTTTTITTTNSNSINGKGAFQLAFEQVVAKQTARAAAAKRKRLQILGGTKSSNGQLSKNQMGPMCDKNTVNLKDNDYQQQQQQQDNIDNFVVTELTVEQRMDYNKQCLDDDDVYTEEHHQQQHQQQQQQNQQQQEQQQFEESEQQQLQQEQQQQEFLKLSKIQQLTTAEEELGVITETISNDENQNPTIIADHCVEISNQRNLENTIEHSVRTVSVATASSSGTNLHSEIQPHHHQQQQQQQQQTQQEHPEQQQQIVGTSITQHNMAPNIGLNKDFIKDSSAEMEQVLGEFTSTEIDLLQVLKGFDTTPGSDAALCDFAGSLGLFNDVDCMNYEEVGTPAKDSETREIRNEIEKRQQQMQRKCDFLLRRLRKIQSRYMGKHSSEEIAGLFEWTNRLTRRKDSDHNRQLSYEDDKYRPVSMSSMKAFLKRIDTTATTQHSNVKRNKVGRPSTSSSSINSSSGCGVGVLQQQIDVSGTTAATTTTTTAQNNKSQNAVSFIPQLDEKSIVEVEHVAGMLQTELKEVQSALDSDVTASSSGGESADEMVTYNNQVQQSLSIAKRAAWRWARDRSAIASRWTWLLTQISDLEYRIRQHTELYNQIKKNKGIVICGKAPPPNVSQTIPSSVNGYRGILPGNSKAIDTDTVPPNGAYDSTGNLSGSCRTRPFQRLGFRKRRLLQTAHVHTVSKRAARSSTVKCGCQWPLHPCALCTGRPDPTAPRDLPDTMPPSERVALLDPGFHPVLSFPEDVGNSIHLETILRSPEWQNRVMRCSTKAALKGALAAQKAAEREDRSKKFADSRRKYNRKFSQDMAANKLKNAKNRRALHGAQLTHLIKNKHRKLFPSNAGVSGSMSTTNYSAGQHGGGFSSVSSTPGSDSTGLHSIDNIDANGVNGSLPRSKNASPTPGYGSSSSYKNERMDRRSRTSYDIDNIVIPYSVAASTRVEILPYKEIPTPKWRIVDDDQIVNENDCTENLPSQEESALESILRNSDFDKTEEPQPSSSSVVQEYSNNDENETEDISNEAILLRHERALIEERRKFQTYLKFPWSTRSRANRRIDSRAESSGANTPDPTSPAPNTPSVAGGDQESIPSPAAPSTPQTPIENVEGVDGVAINNQNLGILNINNQLNSARKVERKRTVSMKREREKEEARRSNSPDPREIIPPFEPLQFPLPDELYESMLQLMPNDHQILEDCLKNDNNCDKITTDASNGIGDGAETRIDSTIVSQNNLNINDDILNSTLAAFEVSEALMEADSDTDSAESGLPEEEDPNDPEWREPA